MSTPYTYIVGWKSQNLYYYGSRYRSGCHPSDLWVSYFTSSKEVAKTREVHGEPDIVQVRKIFPSAEEALEHEHKVLRRMRVKERLDFLNKTNGRDWKQSSDGLRWIRNHEVAELATEVRYIKNSDEIPVGWYFGFFAPSESQRAAASAWSSKNRHSEATKQKMRDKNSGKNNPNYGKKLPEEEIMRLRESAPRGKDNPAFTGIWVLPHGEFETKKAAIEGSPAHIGADTMIKWCKKQNGKKIDGNTYGHSVYLQTLFSLDECFGKTFSQMGFGFIPKTQ